MTTRTMSAMPLIQNWVCAFESLGKSKADALRELNAELGTRYDTSHLSRWERGERMPGPEAQHVMRLAVLRWALPDATAKEIADLAEMMR